MAAGAVPVAREIVLGLPAAAGPAFGLRTGSRQRSGVTRAAADAPGGPGRPGERIRTFGAPVGAFRGLRSAVSGPWEARIVPPGRHGRPGAGLEHVAARWRPGAPAGRTGHHSGPLLALSGLCLGHGATLLLRLVVRRASRSHPGGYGPRSGRPGPAAPPGLPGRSRGSGRRGREGPDRSGRRRGASLSPDRSGWPPGSLGGLARPDRLPTGALAPDRRDREVPTRPSRPADRGRAYCLRRGRTADPETRAGVRSRLPTAPRDHLVA